MKKGNFRYKFSSSKWKIKLYFDTHTPCHSSISSFESLPGKNSIHNTNCGLFCRNERADLCHDCDQCHLLDVGALPSHVGPSYYHDPFTISLETQNSGEIHCPAHGASTRKSDVLRRTSDKSAGLNVLFLGDQLSSILAAHHIHLSRYHQAPHAPKSPLITLEQNGQSEGEPPCSPSRSQEIIKELGHQHGKQ